MASPFKEHIIGDRTFRIRKFTPQVGCQWAFKLIGTVSSVAVTVMGKGEVNDGDVVKKLTNFTNMDPEDFKLLYQNCLEVVFEVIPGGTLQVVNSEGFPSVKDFESPLAFELMTASFLFSMIDFFDKALLARLGGMVQDTFQTVGKEISSSSPSDSNTGTTTTSGTESTP